MSTVRIKRKHVLDSDSDDDDDAPSASVALASVSNGSSEKENAGVGGTPSSPTGDAMEPQIKKRLTKKADPSSVPSPVVAPAPDVVVIDDGLGTTDDDDVIVVDAAATTPVGPVAIEDESDEEDDQALMECARISRRLRRALGHDDDAKGKSDGPLSPGGRASSEPRRLVTTQDVAAVAGDGSRANGLKPYQMVGVNFLLLLDEQDVPGAILADEMGLGKTAQTIAYLACSRAGNALPASADVAKEMRRRRNEPALVVAPASLLENWRRELTTWAPALRVGFYHGGPSQDEVRATAEAWAHTRGDGRSASGGGAFDVIIACYSIFERDSADSREKRAWLRSLNYSHLVLDEAHLVKNRATQRARRLDAVATKARRRVLLTGTPLQNNLGELESLIHLVLPGLLEEGALGTDTYEETDTNELARAHRLQRVKEILRPFILRRLKEEVAKELIPKTQGTFIFSHHRTGNLIDVVFCAHREKGRGDERVAEGSVRRRRRGCEERAAAGSRGGLVQVRFPPNRRVTTRARAQQHQGQGAVRSPSKDREPPAVSTVPVRRRRDCGDFRRVPQARSVRARGDTRQGGIARQIAERFRPPPALR